MSWLLLSCAIASEVGGTLSLRVAASGRRAFYAVLAGGSLMAFVSLSACLGLGMPLGVASGIWTAVGIVLTVRLSTLLFGESLRAVMGLGIALIVGGVLL